MPTEYKVLAQSNPSAGVLTVAYEAPSTGFVVVSSIIVANRSALPTTFRIAFSIFSAAISNEQYSHYDVPIDGNETYVDNAIHTIRLFDRVRVLAADATLSFNFFGSENPW